MAKTKKAQAGLTASNKRVGPNDPNGAWTKVQEMNLPPRNVKTNVSLTENKKLGATSMAKDGKWMQKVSKSIKDRGTEGKCTPITKPCCTGRAKALAKTFKKIAAKRKAK